MTVELLAGDCLELLPALAGNSVDSCVTDPPYHLTSIVKRYSAPDAAPSRDKRGISGPFVGVSSGFMGKQWDGGDIAFRPDVWREVYRVLRPGAHLLAFGGTRTYHRLACAIEDAGFEIRDTIMWVYGSGFPKSHSVSVAIDKSNGVAPRSKAFNMKGRGDRAEEMDTNGREFLPPYEATTEAARQWQGWGTALKPACEPVVLARKPLSEKTVAANVLRWGTGAINVDGCRIETNGEDRSARYNNKPPLGEGDNVKFGKRDEVWIAPEGRWPANLIHDGSEEVLAGFPESDGGAVSDYNWNESNNDNPTHVTRNIKSGIHFGVSGSAARFFYTSKADQDDRLGSCHPTVKPLDLMQYLVRLVTPPKGLVLDPFAGTGTTGEAAFREGMRAVLIEREAEYQADIKRRIAMLLGGPEERAREAIKERMKDKPRDDGPLFA
jgi:site-specific DNA-methyltransferase (adenine-specific)